MPQLKVGDKVKIKPLVINGIFGARWPVWYEGDRSKWFVVTRVIGELDEFECDEIKSPTSGYVWRWDLDKLQEIQMLYSLPDELFEV